MCHTICIMTSQWKVNKAFYDDKNYCGPLSRCAELTFVQSAFLQLDKVKQQA